MILSNLKRTNTAKETYIFKCLESGNFKEVPQELLPADTLFKIFAMGPKSNEKIDVEIHLLWMLKLLYIFNIPFSSESIPTLSKLYVWRTYPHISSTPRKKAKARIKYSYLADEDFFEGTVEAVRSVLKEVRPDWTVGLAYDECLDKCSKYFDIATAIDQQSMITALIRADMNSIEDFDKAIENKTKVFYKEGYYYFPVVPQIERRFENLV